MTETPSSARYGVFAWPGLGYVALTGKPVVIDPVAGTFSDLLPNLASTSIPARIPAGRDLPPTD